MNTYTETYLAGMQAINHELKAKTYFAYTFKSPYLQKRFQTSLYNDAIVFVAFDIATSQDALWGYHNRLVA